MHRAPTAYERSRDRAETKRTNAEEKRKKALRKLSVAAEKVIDVFCLDEFAEKEEEATALQELRDAIAEADA